MSDIREKVNKFIKHAIEFGCPQDCLPNEKYLEQ